jgi:hypothetical protein
MLDVVKLRELPAIIRRGVLLKFAQRLSSQIAAVNQKEHAPRSGVFDQPVDEADGGKRFPGPSRHLDKRAWARGGERFFEFRDRLDLAIAQAVSDERRRLAQPRTQRLLLLHPFAERLRFVEGEYSP